MSSGMIYNQTKTQKKRRLCIRIQGMVQGVGFRPFVYRLATGLGLTGWINNSTHGVQIEAEGDSDRLNEFINLIESEKPALASIKTVSTSFHAPVGDTEFIIRPSDQAGEKDTSILPDTAVCPDCLKEIFDPENRRYRYPFTNCTNCGPRYSIIESLPYDRKNTTMKIFPMCEKCRAEYEDPLNRRFHAQPNACPDCGPHLELWNGDGQVMARYDESLSQICDAIKNGKIAALKGLGGFQLLVDARNDEAIARLRERKARREKPFALMYPNLLAVKKHCEISNLEENTLVSPQSPIVLLKCKTDINPFISANVAPDNPYLGVMLPYTPLHHLLMAGLDFPIVATSGNLADEPICIDEHEALERLKNIADLFLVHNRPIARQVDDSVVRVMMGREAVIRNARGYAPTTIQLPKPAPLSLAVGGHMKNTIAISIGKTAFISQHIGDLETRQACDAFAETIESLSGIYDFRPETTASDLHPDYMSSIYAAKLSLPEHKVQHHYAHILSCMADNQLEGPAFGVCWDGTGLGLDGTIWGSEFLKVTGNSFDRIAHMRTFKLLGGDRAVTEPRRSAIGLLFEIFGAKLFTMPEIIPLRTFTRNEGELLKTMLEKSINSPLTSSAGRLFDAVASIIGLCQIDSYEAHAAIKLEHAAGEVTTDDSYDFAINYKSSPFIINWEPMICSILNDLQDSVSVNLIAARFHNTVTNIIVEIAEHIGENNVVLSGGCFQNKYFLERTVDALQIAGFAPFWHRRIPPNDGGIALGQIMAILNSQEKGV